MQVILYIKNTASRAAKKELSGVYRMPSMLRSSKQEPAPTLISKRVAPAVAPAVAPVGAAVVSVTLSVTSSVAASLSQQERGCSVVHWLGAW